MSSDRPLCNYYRRETRSHPDKAAGKPLLKLARALQHPDIYIAGDDSMKIKSVLIAGSLLMAMAASAGPSTGAGLAVDDSIITAKIKSALVQEPATQARQVKVKTLHGVVQLSGFVDSTESRQRAEVIAGTTEGVTDVHNNLKVRQPRSAP
jgi:BON domain